MSKLLHNSKANILIFGKNGQVGNALCDNLNKHEDFDIQSYSSKDVDFANLQDLEIFLQNIKEKPNFIINAAAYTNVDKAEDEKELADIINHKAVEVIAKFCSENNIILMHYSTDYVFDGSGDEPFEANNTKNLKPINHYGQTKLDGERAIINSNCNYVIIRTSWVYDERPASKNFVNTIKRLAQEKEEISIVCDQIGSPTSATFIAKKTLDIIDVIKNNNLISKKDSSIKNILHFIEEDYMSWHDFACKIIDNMKQKNIKILVKKINPIKTIDYKTKAKRPLNSRLLYSS